MPEMLTLYHASASPNSRRVRMFVAEKGIVSFVSIDLAASEQHGDAYRAINPRRVVPTLVLASATRRPVSSMPWAVTSLASRSATRST